MYNKSNLIEIILRSIFFFLFLLLFIILPKNIFSKEEIYKIVSPCIDCSNENIIMYDYKVFGSEMRMEEGLEKDVKIEKERAKDINEFLIVKIRGEDGVEIKDDYILIYDSSVIELNIEFYLAKNINILESSLPSKTIICLLTDCGAVIQSIYIVLIIFVCGSVMLCQSIKIVKCISGTKKKPVL